MSKSKPYFGRVAQPTHSSFVFDSSQLKYHEPIQFIRRASVEPQSHQATLRNFQGQPGASLRGGAWGAAPPLASEAVGNFLNFVGKSRNFLFS